ncbi:tripartite tricarboxylate transporter substrate binding protein [soil metagenome]
MNMINRRHALGTVAAATLACASPWARAQSLLKTVQIVTGFQPGTTPDVLARKVADKLAKHYAEAIIVENRVGAGGQLAVAAVKSAPADGTSILITPMATMCVYPHTYKRLPYDPQADFLPVSNGVTFDSAIGVGPAVPDSVTDIRGLLAWMKANPMLANIASPATGSPLHFMVDMLARSSGVNITHVGYRGSSAALGDMIGGSVPAFSGPLGSFLNQPRLRVLATAGEKRSRFLPNVATFQEQGFPTMLFSDWMGFFVPAKTPPERIRQLNDLLRDALLAPDTVSTLTTFGMEATPSTPEALSRLLADDLKRWRPIVKTIGFTADS